LKEPRRLANKVHAYASILRNWRSILQSRKATQALRSVRDRDLLAQCEWRLAYEQTGSGLVGRLAHMVFDPVFFIVFRLSLAVIRW
jgi:hypothetical protein